ncbi:SEFIR domain-containing protein [Amycolatopsis sp. cmx-8-4]|uniref:SEFIR domain-containing protein n=1 Tax=Amycolatopsis sp. cmx-8-4 TaxID=2790947 RepID=UPI0039796ABA
MPVTEPGGAGTSPRVYVSYAHDSAEHTDAVREFAAFLRTEAGVDARLDAWSSGVRRDWTAWTIGQLKKAEFVLVIASPQHKSIVDGGPSSATGRANQLEGAMLRDNLARDLPGETRRILPVVLPGHTADEIPDCLCGYSATHYRVSELTVDGVRDLLAVLAGMPLHAMPPLRPFVPPAPRVDPVVPGLPGQQERTARILAADAEVEIGESRYLVQSGTLDVRPSRDQASVERRARALRIGPPHEHVWLRQVELRQETPAAKAASAAVVREHGLLVELQGRDRGLPRALRLVEDSRSVTSVTLWPVSRSLGGPCDALAAWLPHRGETIDDWQVRRTLLGLAGLGRTLALLHAQGLAHRRLAPAELVRFDDGNVQVRDLGLAVTSYQPGEGPGPYQAPEQGVRHNGHVGPWTDVYQVAAVTYHMITGFPPAPAFPLPLRASGAVLPAGVTAAVDTALVPDPSRRPDMRSFVAALQAVRDHRL